MFDADPHQFQWWAVSLVRGQPTQPEKKGGDRGIDGRLVFMDTPEGAVKAVVISVKGGGAGPSDVRDLRGVCDREGALGVFVMLREPTREMRAEATGAGEYTSPLYGRAFPKLQIVTIKQLLDSKGDARGALRLPATVPFMPAAKREASREGEQTSLI